MNKIKKLAGETVLYGLGSILPRFLNFLLVYLHSDVFAPEEYGVITKLMAYVAVINTIFMFGMETAYFRYASKPGADVKKIFNLTQSVVLLISGVLSILLILLSDPIASSLDIMGRGDLVTWLVLIMFIDAAVAIPFAQLRLQKQALKFVTSKIINIAILIGLNIYFLKFATSDQPDIGFVFLANLIANAFFLLFFAKTLLSWRPAFDRTLSPQIFSYSYPIMLTGLAGITNEMFSRITLEAWLPEGFYPGKTNKYALGVFGACYKFGVLMNLAIQSFRYAAEPFFFSNAAEKNSPQLFAKVNHYFIVVCCILLFTVSVNLDILKYFLANPEYWTGLDIVPVLLLAYLFLGVYYNISVWFKLTDKTYFGTVITIGGALITIVANYYLIPLFGYEGSAWAALMCYATMTIACYVLGQKFLPVPYYIVKGTAYIVSTMVLIYLINSIEISDRTVDTIINLCAVIAYVVVIFLIERKELLKRQA
jgi:O-antigen/teichoic acid export membrane protein